jgi:tRNA(Ile2) C34 agmatinyltransferase TiaS
MQVCPKCLELTEQIDKGDIRHWRCRVCKTKRAPDKEGPLELNKDRSAAFLMVRVFFTIIISGGRPEQLTY